MTAEIRANSGRDRRLEAAASPAEAGVTAESAEPAEPSCNSCRFFLARRIHQAAEKLGQCRRHAAGPIVQASDWCGDHQPAREA